MGPFCVLLKKNYQRFNLVIEAVLPLNSLNCPPFLGLQLHVTQIVRRYVSHLSQVRQSTQMYQGGQHVSLTRYIWRRGNKTQLQTTTTTTVTTLPSPWRKKREKNQLRRRTNVSVNGKLSARDLPPRVFPCDGGSRARSRAYVLF